MQDQWGNPGTWADKAVAIPSINRHNTHSLTHALHSSTILNDAHFPIGHSSIPTRAGAELRSVGYSESTVNQLLNPFPEYALEILIRKRRGDANVRPFKLYRDTRRVFLIRISTTSESREGEIFCAKIRSFGFPTRLPRRRGNSTVQVNSSIRDQVVERNALDFVY